MLLEEKVAHKFGIHLLRQNFMQMEQIISRNLFRDFDKAYNVSLEL